MGALRPSLADETAACRGAPGGRPRDRLGGALDLVRRGGRSRSSLGVELEPGGARVAVARLADAAGVEQPPAVGHVELRPARPGRPRSRRRSPSSAAARRRARRGSGRSKLTRVACCAMHSPPGRARARTPRRVARRGVVERDLVARVRGDRPARKSRALVGSVACVHSRPRPRPARTTRCRARPSTARSWLPDRQTVAALAHDSSCTRSARRRSRRRRPGTRPRRRGASISASTASSAGRLPWMSLRIARPHRRRGRPSDPRRRRDAHRGAGPAAGARRGARPAYSRWR